MVTFRTMKALEIVKKVYEDKNLYSKLMQFKEDPFFQEDQSHKVFFKRLPKIKEASEASNIQWLNTQYGSNNKRARRCLGTLIYLVCMWIQIGLVIGFGQ